MKITYFCEYPTTTTVVSTTTTPTTPLHKTITEVTDVSTLTTPTTPIHEATFTTVSPILPKWEQVPSKISTESINLVTMNHADSSSEKRSVTTVAVSITAGILLVLVIVLVGVVFIKRRQAAHHDQDNTHVQCNAGNVVNKTGTNRAYVAACPPGNNTELREYHSKHDYEKGAALIAINTRNKNAEDNLLKDSSDTYI